MRPFAVDNGRHRVKGPSPLLVVVAVVSEEAGLAFRDGAGACLWLSWNGVRCVDAILYACEFRSSLFIR